MQLTVNILPIVDHYPKQSKAVLLSSTPQGSLLNNLGNPTESRKTALNQWQHHSKYISQPSPVLLNIKGTVTHPQSGSNTQLARPEANKTNQDHIRLYVQTSIVPRPVNYYFSHDRIYIPW